LLVWNLHGTHELASGLIHGSGGACCVSLDPVTGCKRFAVCCLVAQRMRVLKGAMAG
jgi:hypothetical protein